MREVEITEKCLDFIDSQGQRVSDKFFQLIEIMEEVKVVHSNFVKKLKSTKFYELRIKAGNEYRVIVFTIDKPNFIESMNVVCLNGFMKNQTRTIKKPLGRRDN